MGTQVPPTPASPAAPTPQTPNPNPNNIPDVVGNGAIARIREIASNMRAQIKIGDLRIAPAEKPAPAPAPTPATTTQAATEAAPTEAPKATDQARDSKGKFIQQPKAGEEAPPAPAEAATDAGDDVPGDEAEPTVEVVSFEFPAVEGQAAHVIEVPADDPETLAQLRSLTAAADRVPELQRQLSSMQREGEKYGAIEHHLRHDPVSFVVGRVHDNIAKDVALALAARPGVLEAIKDQLAEWGDNPDARRADYAELQSDTKERTRQLSSDWNNSVKETRFVNELVARVERVASAVAPDRSGMFTDDAIGALEAHFRKPNSEMKAPTDEELVKIMGHRLGLYNVNEADALSALKGGAKSRQVPTAQPTAEAAKKLEDAKGTGRRLVASKQARQRASAVPPSTGGAPAATPAATPPAGQKMEDRFKWVRDRLGLPQSGPKQRGPGIPTR